MRSPAKHPRSDSQDFARHNFDSQLPLVIDNLVDLQRELVKALGGVKSVAARLYPQKDSESAHRYLLDCLNPNRDHDMGIEGFFTLLRWAREKGIHFGLHWLCDELHYSRPQSIEPEDRAADVLHRVDAVRGELTDLLKQLERLPRGSR